MEPGESEMSDLPGDARVDDALSESLSPGDELSAPTEGAGEGGQPCAEKEFLCRRAHERHTCRWKTEVAWLNDQGRAYLPIWTTVVDISAGGAAIQCRRAVHPSTMGVMLLHGGPSLCRLRYFRVVRCFYDTRRKTYQAGVVWEAAPEDSNVHIDHSGESPRLRVA